MKLNKISSLFLALAMVMSVGVRAAEGTCPAVDFTPEALEIDHDEAVPFVDKNRPLKDLSTDTVNRSLFGSKDTLFNFMKLVYQTIDNDLAAFRKENNLPDRSMFLIFKGGNVLRMVANEVFDQLNQHARTFLQKEYSPYFKRSDADFSVYVDEKLLNGMDYDTTLDKVAGVIFKSLNVIRAEIKANPERYFNIDRLNDKMATAEMARSFAEANELPVLKDPTNDKWFNGKFKQMQLRSYAAVPESRCDYKGQYDYRYEMKDGKIAVTRLNDEPNWMYNTDNRTLEWRWGSNSERIVKFWLERTKVAFEFTVDKDGEMTRVVIGGEKIDVSIPHRLDYRLRWIFDNYDIALKSYKLTLEEKPDESFSMLAYSLLTLVEDLQFIILDSFNRPWEGNKYEKRVYRIFYLFIVELMTAYSKDASAGHAYLTDVQTTVLDPLKNIDPSHESSKMDLETVKKNIADINTKYPKMALTNHFFSSVEEFMERIGKEAKSGDKKGVEDLVNYMEENIKNMQKLLDLVKDDGFRQNEIYDVEMKNLF